MRRRPHERTRIAITLNVDMLAALELLATRSNLPIATQAMVTLRQALDATMRSQACIDRARALRSFRSAEQWREDCNGEAEVTNAEKAAARSERRAAETAALIRQGHSGEGAPDNLAAEARTPVDGATE